MRAASSLLFLLLLPAAAGLFVGEERVVHHGSIDPAAPAVGDGFVSWVDFGSNTQQVQMFYENELYTLSKPEREGDSHSAVDAHGGWLVWELSRVPSRLPGETVGSYNRDLVVYDLSRGQVFDSGTPGFNETRPRVAGDRLVYLNDESGRFQVHQMDLRGNAAFRSSAVLPTGNLQVQPDVSEDWIVFLERTEAGDGIRLIGSDGSPEWFREPARLGYKDPVLHGNVLAWTSYQNGMSSLHWQHLLSGEGGQFTSAGIFGRPTVNGEMLAVSLSLDGQKTIHVACFGGELVPVEASQPRFAPSLGSQSLYALGVTTDGSDLLERRVSCGGDIDQVEETPFPFTLAVLALGTIARLWPCAGRPPR